MLPNISVSPPGVASESPTLALLRERLPDPSGGHVLLSLVDGISTFEGYNRWDADATDFVTRGQSLLRNKRLILAKIEDSMEAEKRADAVLRGFFKRLFAPLPAIKALKELRGRVNVAVVSLPPLMDLLSATIDKTPNSPAERDAMVQDLEMAIGALRGEVKGLQQATRAAKVSAREARAHVNGMLHRAVSSPKSRQWERASIRLQEDAAIKRNATLQQRLERQMSVLDAQVSRLKQLR